MRYYSLLVCLLVSLLALPNITIAAATSPTTAPNVPATQTASTVNSTQTHPDWQYQQLFAMHNQLARLDEKLKQQTALGSDVKALESTQQALKVQLANLQTKLEAQEKVQTNQLNGFDGRISDLAFYLSFYGVIITLLAFGLGFTAKATAIKEAKQQANIASDKHMQEWLENNKEILISKAKAELEKVSLELKERAEKLEAEAKTALEKIKQEQQQALQVLLDASKDIVNSEIDKEEKVANKHNKSKTYLTAQECFKAGLNAFLSDEYDEALNAWNKVLELVNSEQEPMLYAITMFNQGVTYEKQDKLDEARDSYKILIEQFKKSTNEAIQEQVAKAMVNQGFVYSKQNKLDDELSSYSTLIEQFKASTNEAIQEQVARAMALKGVTYGRLQDFTAVQNQLSELLDRFSDADNTAIKWQVDIARANIAELALLFETPEKVITRITEVENTSKDSRLLVVMQFIRFLLGDKTIDDVLTAITDIPKEMELTWQFDEIKDYLAANFTGEKQQQIQAVVAFFEQHKDIAQLKSELKIES